MEDNKGDIMDKIRIIPRERRRMLYG